MNEQAHRLLDQVLIQVDPEKIIKLLKVINEKPQIVDTAISMIK